MAWIFNKKQVVLTSRKYPKPQARSRRLKRKKSSRGGKEITKKIGSIFKKFITKPTRKKEPKKTKKVKKPEKSKERRRKKMVEKEPKKVKAKKEKPKKAKPAEVQIGKVTHFFPHVNAAVIKLKKPLFEGETVHIKGHTTDFTEQVTSIQADNKPIKEAKKGDEIGLLVKEKVRGGDIVYKVT